VYHVRTLTRRSDDIPDVQLRNIILRIPRKPVPVVIPSQALL
jgi:hypothetical protein